jgi:acyl-CoA synthetase (AMP-forming)/AMP-acid ligase II
VPHAQYGEVGVAFIIPRGGAAPSAGQLFAFLRERLASFKIPSHFAMVDVLPLTAGTEKVQKFRLREQALALVAADSAAPAATRPT